MGRSQAVRQRVLVPRSQVRILAAQSSRRDPSSNLAAVVMAGGLGTRMRSSVPKHLHPLLGRRVIDWVIEAAREAGADPIVIVASPDSADAYEGMEVAVQEQPLGTGDAVASARDALAGFDRQRVRARCGGAAPDRRAPGERSPPSTTREDAAVTILSFEPSGRSRTAGSSAAPTGASRRSSRTGTRPRSSGRSASSTPRSTSSTPARSGRRSRSSTRTTRRASST